MRLIDADAVKFRVEYGYDNNGVLLVPYRDIKKSIEAAKTVDAVPVVRCKECKHYDLSVCLKIYSDGSVHPAAWQSRKPEDFCSYGERKAGAENGKRREDAHAQD
jgi:hypothetical protein